MNGRELFELYRAPIDGLRCLRSAGRIRRLKLPLPADPPQDDPPAACFFCHPERDRLDLGPWPRPAGALRVIGNAHAVADRMVLVAPAGESVHAATPATLAVPLLADLLRAPLTEAFAEAFGFAPLQRVAFMNVGRRAAQSRRHPHLQVVGFRPERGPLAEADRTAIAVDICSALQEDRTIDLGTGLRGIIPSRPSMTAELWLPLPSPDAPEPAWLELANGVGRAAAAAARRLSGDLNLVLRLEEPALIRIIPRGLSERAGLELAAPALLSGVVATSVRESLLLWRTAIV